MRSGNTFTVPASIGTLNWLILVFVIFYFIAWYLSQVPTVLLHGRYAYANGRWCVLTITICSREWALLCSYNDDMLVRMGAAVFVQSRYANAACALPQAFPFEQGRAVPLWFPFLPSFWRTGKPAAAPFSDGELHSVRASGLHKTFGKFAAVDGCDFKFKRGQVYALLGHNVRAARARAGTAVAGRLMVRRAAWRVCVGGRRCAQGAGKTTVIKMMTGALAPNKGDCIIAGYSVNDQIDPIRQLIGVCPQVLLPRERASVVGATFTCPCVAA